MTSRKPDEKQTHPKPLAKRVARNESMGARRTVIEELFNDLYNDRRNIYLMNFIRGIFFGLGSALGGTLVIALIVWALSIFVGLPGIGDAFQQVQDTISSEEER
ncbi:hypothetical protein A2707_01760 [Candidatus Saccharibacteria bacterium RIFCSPHIGHO2_01_FULL_45_15]|nr:MAG: hypothetical protein A2707_01760 [Candidatus Saccharibacteria bacterium RIFCSPHIGHO2_01_FULL_45_15]OGL27801.1 MAG: hypothetical protein A3C39_04430 [Candidatus Saccharibacteria bacterium RIFCSPHIGHO2_02_FULL_46_12]OGL31690.1 MAG: hypothetical protein A3E76_01080 [Candidatus Saccharibacteria bacterium RIFCSPHIGHO2_12_FULL_44_22]